MGVNTEPTAVAPDANLYFVLGALSLVRDADLKPKLSLEMV